MKILQISPRVPYPLNEGGAIGIFNITKFLSLRGNEIVFLAFTNDDTLDYSEFKKYCKLITIKRNLKNTIPGAIRNLFTSIPFTYQKYKSPEAIEIIDSLIQKEKFDVVHVDHLHVAAYGKYIKEKYNIPVILREHNYETMIWKRMYENEASFLKRLFIKMQMRKVENYEVRMCSLFDRCFMITKNDEDNLKEHPGIFHTEIIPAGVDVNFFQEKYSGKKEKQSLLFLGSLEWYPNLDAFNWFYNSVFPLIIRKYPEIKLYLAGKNPPESILNLKDKNVCVLGMVDDIREIMDKCEVCVVPLRIGGGIRIKILEMMAMKKAIVSTNVGCEGMEVIDHKHLLTAPDAESFANAVSLLIENDNLRSTLEIEGFNLVNRIYKWENIAEKMESVYTETIKYYKK
jgi:polysaccharide biosynthesis protein PslH